MNLNFIKIITLALLVALGLLIYQSILQPPANYRAVFASSPLEQKIHYRIGQIDPRFNISLNQFATLIQQAALIWETPLQRQFFIYDPEASFAINLIYDERQQLTEEKDKLSQQLDDEHTHNQSTTEQYQREADNIKHQQQDYQLAGEALQRKIRLHEETVRDWNNQGGAPATEVSRLQAERAQLNQEVAYLNQQKDSLDRRVTAQNALGQRIHNDIQTFNTQVTEYNGKFAKRQFEKGVFNGKEINIYQYQRSTDLRLVIAHELGHALGLKHSTDPLSLMYPILEKQDMDHFVLTQADMDLLLKK